MQTSLNLAQTVIFSNREDNRQSSSCSNKILQEKENRNLKKIYAKNQTLEECLSTLDIFKTLMDDADQMKSRIIRDVSKSIYLSVFDQGDIIYDIQDQSNQIFLIFQGAVSLKIRKKVESEEAAHITQNQEKPEEFIYEEVETFEKGQGFGQAQFIRARTRDFQASVKVKGSIIGRLHIQSFQEVVENYKMRIYYRKLEMFRKCPLLSEISGNRLEFIVNSSKPIILGMSKIVARQGQQPKCLYLLSKGQVQFIKSSQKDDGCTDYLNSWKSKKVSKYFVNPFESKDKLQIRKLYQGSFIGDVQIALNQHFDYEVVTASEKVYLYACDIRLILSQIPAQDLQISKIFYENKQLIKDDQLSEIRQVRKLANENSIYSNVKLTEDQIQIRKKIRKRYSDTIPNSLIDQSSPKQISKMLDRKHSRIKTQCLETECKLPRLELFEKKSLSPKKKMSYSLDFNEKAETKRKLSSKSQNLSPSPTKEQYSKQKSDRQFLKYQMPEKLQQFSKRDLKIISKKRKIALPPIVSISIMKKKIRNQESHKVVPYVPTAKEEQFTLRHRMSEFVGKIQLIQCNKQHQK